MAAIKVGDRGTVYVNIPAVVLQISHILDQTDVSIVQNYGREY